MPTYQLNFDNGYTGYFETENSTLYTQDKKPIEIEHFMPHMPKAETFSGWDEEGLLHKSNKPNFIRIVMGFNCNFNCKYCSQTYADKHKKTSVEEAVTFAIKLCEVIKGEPKVIEFWGGEPLMYFKHLKAMFPIIRNRFPHTRFTTVTNGSLITKEIMEFLWEWRVSTAISHDGLGQHVRGKDFLLDPKKRGLWHELWERYEKHPVDHNTPRIGVGFIVTMNNTNPNISDNVRYIKEHFDPKVQVMGSVATTLGSVNHLEGYREVAFTSESLKQMELGVYQNLLEDSEETNCAEIFDNKRDLINRLMYHDTYYGLTRCGADGENKLYVKLDGSILYCQNYDVKPNEHGSLWDLKNVKIHGITKYQDRESCMHCPVIHLCRGGCPNTKGLNFVELCTVYNAFFRPILKNVIEQTYGTRLVSITGDIRVPSLTESTEDTVVYNKIDGIYFDY